MQLLDKLDRARRVGVVTPPANPAVEPEVHALMPDGVVMYATRLPVFPGDLRERNRQYSGAYPAAGSRAFARARSDIVISAR